MGASNAARSKHLYLVDGSGFIFRAYHALPPLTRPDGTPVNAVLGFTNMLMKLIEEPTADHLAVIFDAGRHTFRNEIYDQYKANRPEPPEDLIPQFALTREATRAFGVPAIEMAGFEADDLIATYARLALEQGYSVCIVSSDKDLMQLIRDGVGMVDPLKNKPIGRAEVEEKFGVGPEKVVEIQALAGDSSDNVPGVPGIGVKTAAELIRTYGDLETLLARAGEIKQPKRREALIANAEKARISRALVQLRDDVPVPAPIDSFGKCPPDPATLVPFLREQNFRSVLQRLEARGISAPAAPEPAAQAGGAAAAKPPARARRTADPLPAKPMATGRGTYTLVQDEAALAAWIARAVEIGTVAVDTETTGLDPMKAALVGVSLAVEPGEGCYIPLAHVIKSKDAAGGLALEGGTAPTPAQMPAERALALLKPLLADPAVLKVGHNIKFDAQILGRYGAAVTPVDDTMLISYVLEGGAHGHGMDELSALHLGYTPISYDQVTGTGKARISFAEVALDAARDYAAEDADVTLRLHGVLKPRLLAERMVTVYETLERALSPVLLAMERRGITVDRDALRRLSNDFAQRLQALEARIHEAAGRSFNVGSPSQLGALLFDEMGLPSGEARKTKTGAWSTDSEVLEGLAAQGHALPGLVLEWRQLAKLKSTYADALVEQINADTGRVHTCYSMAVASTGRLSSNDPNLQNIPVRTEEGRKIRQAFVPATGQVFLSFDYSQIELRLLAHVADIQTLKDAFRDGIDIHALTASQVFGVPVKGMDPMVRRRAKAINFGIIYGISPFGLGRQLGIPQGEARAYIDAYFQRYPGIRAYMDRTKDEARRQGYVTTPFGRRIHLPGIKDKNPARRSFMERAAINAPLQGGAADIIKRAMVRIPAALEAAGLGAAMLLQVHDELLFEVPPAEVTRTIETVRQVMEGAASLSVPLTVEAGQGASWAEAH